MRNELAAVLLVVAIFAGAGVGYLASNQLTSARTSTETTWLTSTETALQSSASVSNWRFVASISATTIEVGQSLLLWANLTNTSPSNQTIRPFVGPYISSRVVAANGTVVWTWEPPVVTWPSWTWTSGQTLSQEVDIPTTGFRAGSYLVEVSPLSQDFGQLVSETFNLTLPLSAQVTTSGPTNLTSTSEVNTYVTSCIITGVGGFEFRVVSDSTGTPISGETIKAVDRLGCGGTLPQEQQVVYIDNFSESQGGGGWLVPDFPSQATPAGGLSFTISYQGQTYYFTAYVAPVGTNCVTLHVPSGNVTTTFASNGSGSYCS